jgi:hypothetical protein
MRIQKRWHNLFAVNLGQITETECPAIARSRSFDPKLSGAEMNAFLPEHLKNAAVNSKAAKLCYLKPS